MMNIALTDDLQRLLRKQVENGTFPNEEAVVEEALRLFLNRKPEKGHPQTSDATEPETERLPGPFIEDETVLAPEDLARTGQEVVLLYRHELRGWSKITVPKYAVILYCYYGKVVNDFQCPAEV
jgi:Arc/MetJ-type ribon-helix-helix transcriptional regulator